MSETNGYTCSPFVGDGYDYWATIAAKPGYWETTKIWYRCMTADEESVVRQKIRSDTSKSPVRHFAELFVTKLQRWDLKDHKGNIVAITADTLCSLISEFNDLLHAYFDGSLPSDEQREVLERFEDQQKNSLAA